MTAQLRLTTVALALLAGAILMPDPAQGQTRLEYAVKANYLVRFAAFVDWPARAFARPDAPLVICVAGRDPFGAVLTRAAAGQTAHGRPIRVLTGIQETTAGACHILYMGAGANSSLTTVSAAFGRLTVTDDAAATRGGMLHFVIQSGRVRFHIDEAETRSRGLAISSRLLALALTVRET